MEILKWQLQAKILTTRLLSVNNAHNRAVY